MTTIQTYFKIATPQAPNTSVGNNQNVGGGGAGLYGNFGWYQRLIQGSSTRIIRYREYDMMDNDIDVSRALDIMAEEMTGNDTKNRMPLNLIIEAGSEENVPAHVYTTLRAGLRTWCKVHNWQGGRLFNIARTMIKYGDCFFERNANKNKRNRFIHPKHVLGAIVSKDDITDIRGWQISNAYLEPEQNQNTPQAGNSTDESIKSYDREQVIRFSLSDDMSDEAPFGVSVLRPAYKVFKQKELLEDSVLIYRITRAPEKRVYYIDVGNRPDHLVPGILEKFKNQLRQKKIPTRYGGKWQTESIYNPQSMNEDIFLPVGPNGTGSKVETLPGGTGLGELTELDYFYRKMWRGLRIPSSYIGSSTEDGQAIANEGKVGLAYIQEIKFYQYIQRLQRYMEEVLDEEFKRWIYNSNIKIDPTIYRIVLPEPSDYGKSRQQGMDTESLNNYGSIEASDILSKQFLLERYLGLTKDEIKYNEELIRKEKNIQGTGDDRDLPLIYWPEAAEAGGLDGGIGGGPGGGAGALDGGLDDDGGFGDDTEGDGDNPDDTEGDAANTDADADTPNQST